MTRLPEDGADLNSATGALADWLAAAAGADALRILGMDRLVGGAIQENWGITVELDSGKFAGLQEWVLRTDAPSGLATSRGREEEFALLRAAHEAGVTVPEPLFLCTDPAVLGKPFYVMRRVTGRAEGHLLVRDPGLAQYGEALAERLGRELARIHSIAPPRPDLAFLKGSEAPPVFKRIATYRSYLDALPEPNPAFEWALRRLELNAPRTGRVVLCHCDFRTGNYMVDDGELTGILDWEFADWGDPMEDIGWFCYRYWRFEAEEREAGGIGSRDAFYRGYKAESGREVDRAAIPFWEVMAAVRWGIIALQQGERHLSGGEESLELVLTGLRAPIMEMDALLGIERLSGEVGA